MSFMSTCAKDTWCQENAYLNKLEALLTHTAIRDDKPQFKIWTLQCKVCTSLLCSLDRLAQPPRLSIVPKLCKWSLVVHQLVEKKKLFQKHKRSRGVVWFKSINNFSFICRVFTCFWQYCDNIHETTLENKYITFTNPCNNWTMVVQKWTRVVHATGWWMETNGLWPWLLQHLNMHLWIAWCWEIMETLQEMFWRGPPILGFRKKTWKFVFSGQTFPMGGVECPKLK